MCDCYTSLQIQINLFMCTDNDSRRIQIFEGYYYFISKGSLWKSFSSDIPVDRKIVLHVLEYKALPK